MGYNSIQGVYVFGEDNTLVYNPDEHVRFPQVQEESHNNAMQDAYDQLASETLKDPEIQT
jgi:hypothetical protein